MKLIFLLIIGLLIHFQSFGQDPDLYDTWYLKAIYPELGDEIIVAEIDPPISPTMIVTENLIISGIVCNEYGGEMSYNSGDDSLHLIMFGPCLCGTCNNPPQSHVDLENSYFSFFIEGADYTYTIVTETNGDKTLRLDNPIFSTVVYRNTLLSLPGNMRSSITLFPNPTSETIFIDSINIQIQQMLVYSLSGQKVIEISENTDFINVSGLSKGMYFLEIFSEGGNSIQKFIKK